MWLQNTKPSNAASPWELSGQALSKTCSSTVILGLCSEGTISLFLQHKFFVSGNHHQAVPQQRDKGTQHLLCYFMPCKTLGLWCPVFDRGCSQDLLRDLQALQPWCLCSQAAEPSPAPASLPGWGWLRVRQSPWLDKELLEGNGADPSAVCSV